MKHALTAHALVLALFVALPLYAAEPPAPQPTIAPLMVPQLNSGDPKAPAPQPRTEEDDKEVVAKIEAYFNTIRTLKADFMQTLSDGSNVNGKLYLKRPGKMRLEYAAPNKDLMVADGTFVHAYDSKAKTSSSIPLGRSMADVILRDPLKLSGDITVTAVRSFPGMYEIDLAQSNDPASGVLTLELQDNPLRLKNWRVKDATGAQTRVSLSNETFNQDIPSSTFAYRDPNFGR